MFGTHQHYEELCALAASGQMPESDVTDFRAHLADCPECSALLADFARTSAYLAASHAAGQRSHDVPDGMMERFIARARTQGIAMNPGIVSRKTKSPVPLRTWAAMAGVAAALVLIVAWVVKTKAPGAGGFAQNTATHASDTAQAAVSRPPSSRDTGKPGVLPGPVDTLVARLKDSLEALASSRRKEEDLEARLASLELEKEGLKANDGEHVATISRLQAEKADLKANDREHLATISRLQTDINKLQADIDKLNREKAANDVAILAEENELRGLRQALAQKDAALEQQRHFVGVGSQVRDLVVARNLHIIDVYDADGQGNQQRPFGRIFYTEGKSLIFYAYDLNSSQTIDQQISFYAWGERLGGGQPVKRLGIFHNEDVNDGRWVLTFDDPRVLTQINSVFVTMEQEKKAVIRPTGKKILFAFLGNKPNHP